MKNCEQHISPQVVKRLPRYYRYLEDMLEAGLVRTSSKELSAKSGLTASQIRQDLNCFGGFGQQGYGYNIEQLYNEIGKILALDNKNKTILIG
ncbi:MAG TPA: winged-helix domain-containing protein, partial [Clostridia bacterium]|nr:winged-helix domain-containing protein [Clostridia bacterium]